MPGRDLLGFVELFIDPPLQIGREADAVAAAAAVPDPTLGSRRRRSSARGTQVDQPTHSPWEAPAAPQRDLVEIGLEAVSQNGHLR
eukprot:scaffold3535_cov107-Isochrysis_galbana.AAC.4